MEGHTKMMFILGLVAIASISQIYRVEGAGECGKNTTPDNEAIKLAPCATAAQDENASVSQSCCVQLTLYHKFVGEKRRTGFEGSIAVIATTICDHYFVVFSL
ncbi:hypothetical protein AHAS_Ahas02G0181500 [Arachis hypogaea]